MKDNNGKKKNMMAVFSDGGTDEAKKARFEAGGIISMAALLGGGVFQILWMSTITRMLGERDMGLFGPLFFGFYIVGTLIGLGAPQTITTFVSLHYESDIEESKRFLVDGMRLLLTAIVALVVVSLIVFPLLGAVGALDWMTAIMFLVFALSCVQGAYFWGINCVLSGFQRLDLVAIGNLVFPAGVLVCSYGLISLAQKIAGAESRWDVVGSLAGLGLGHGMAAAAALICVVKMKRFPLSDIISLRSKHGLYGKILKFGGWAAVAMTCMTIVQNLPAIVAREVGMRWLLYAPTLEECEGAIGRFSTSLIFGMAAMLLVGIAIAIVPAISEAEGQGRKDLMRHYYTKALEQSFSILIMFIMAFAVLIGPIIELISGPQFPAEKMGLLGTLAIFGGAGAGVLFVMVNMFIGLKRPNTAGVTLIAVIILMGVSITAFSFAFRDIKWAHIAFIFSTWLGNIVLFNRSRVMFDMPFPVRTLVEPLIAGIGPFLIVKLLMPEPSVDKLWIMGADIAILAVPYFFILWLLTKRRAAPAAQ